LTGLGKVPAGIFVALAIAAGLTAALAQELPALTGRVVDNAHILTPASQSSLETKLKDLEDKSGIQLVVATVPSLGGQDIEPYANDLARKWALGQKQKDNGVLLLVAPNEHKVRIETGYGLEGTLTDALSKVIIANAIVPRFKANDYSGGIERGVDDIVTVLTTDSADWQARPELRVDDRHELLAALMPFLIFCAFWLIFWAIARHAQSGGGTIVRRGGNIIFIPSGAGWSGSFGGSSSFGGGLGGGFSGGGGGFGGGGASGSW
jgi:uncharacterized protein